VQDNLSGCWVLCRFIYAYHPSWDSSCRWSLVRDRRQRSSVPGPVETASRCSHWRETGAISASDRNHRRRVHDCRTRGWCYCRWVECETAGWRAGGRRDVGYAYPVSSKLKFQGLTLYIVELTACTSRLAGSRFLHIRSVIYILTSTFRQRHQSWILNVSSGWQRFRWYLLRRFYEPSYHSICNGVFRSGCFYSCSQKFFQCRVFPQGTWVWLADHDLDLKGDERITAFAGRGILSESQGPVWMIGTACSLTFPILFSNTVCSATYLWQRNTMSFTSTTSWEQRIIIWGWFKQKAYVFCNRMFGDIAYSYGEFHCAAVFPAQPCCSDAI